MFRSIDPRSPTPLYAQIADRLRVAVATGEIGPGASLPSVRHLAGQLRVNPATVVQAYRELEQAGVIESRQGAGTFVRAVGEPQRSEDRLREARRLVRALLRQAAEVGVTPEEIEVAWQQEVPSRERGR